MKLQAHVSCRVGQNLVSARRVVSCRSRLGSHQPCTPGSPWRALLQRHPSALGSLHNASLNSSSSSRPRGLITAAAGKSGDEGSEAAYSLEALSKMKVPELKDLCKQLGLQVTGNKPVLAQRIFDAQQQQQQAGTGTPAAAADERDELQQELVVELSSYADEELLSCLSERGLSTAGSREELVQRLAAAVADETLGGDEAGPETQQQQQQQQGSVPAGTAPAPPPPEREWLIADKQQVLLDELLAMGVMRQELVDILTDMGQEAAEDETLEALAERASWLLAEEEVLLMEQQAAGGDTGAGGQGDESAAPAQEALAEHPSSILDGLTATDINKMKVDDLRKYLRALGLSDEGSRYVLRDRLVTMLVVRKAATAGDMDFLLRQLASMTLSELRGELERRGLDLSGTKSSLELRLAQAMVVEIAGPQAAGLLGPTAADKEQAEAFEPDAPLAEDYDEFLTAVLDPAFRVALICGTAPADAALSSSSSSSSRLYRVSQALATAVTLIDELHTAPLDPKQAAAMEAAAAAPPAAADPPSDSSSSSSGKAKRGRKTKTDSQPAAAAAAAAEPSKAVPSKVPACGITVDVYWGDESGAFYQLPRTALAATAPADVAAVLPALATARFESAAALAQHLQSSGAGAALSLLPGGALACGGQLSAACAAAGVPLAVQDSSSSSRDSAPSKGRRKIQQQQQQQPVLGRSAVLKELQQRGYMTLPVFEVQRDQVSAAKSELESWLASVAPAEEQQEEADPDDAFADSAGADSAGSSSSSKERKQPVSPLLKAWSAARYGDSAAAEAADDADNSADSAAAAAAAAGGMLPPFVQQFMSWCETSGLDPDSQLLSVCGAAGGEVLAAVRGGGRMLQDLLDRVDQASCPQVLLVEPLHRQLCRWEVVVTVSPEDGPVSLLPVEVEAVSIKQEILDAELALQEWRMMQAGLEPEEIAAQLEAMSQDEPDCLDTLQLTDSPDPVPYNQIKLHSPPRASTKLIHTMRHAAAKAVSDLGLSGAGLVRVRGWYALQPDWQEAYSSKPQDIKKMPDADPRQLQRMRHDDLAKRASESLPLSDYYDELLLMPDLAKWEAGPRCRAESNGEGDVLLADVSVEVPLHATSLAGIQASEVGLGPGGLARHLINMALFAAGQEPLLPPPHPPAFDSSAQWAQFTGANDTLQEIAQQLADTSEKIVEALELGHHRVAERERSAAVQQLDADAAVTSIIDGLSFAGGTMEALQARAQEPEEWTPQFDTRTLQEIHAERDAHRTAEDLAARQMRDENIPVYGDQPIKYDRYDPMLDWEPPFVAAAEAGRPVPSIEQLRQEVSERLKTREQELAEGEQDLLPVASEDEVMYARLLEGSFYEGGVKETLRRRAEQAQETAGGGGAATMAAAALTANLEAAELAGEAAALADAAAAGSSTAALLASSSGSDSLKATADRWPWPSAEEVLDEAAERRAAQRVWVLMGGDGPGRQQALRSGANIVAKLQRCCDLQVDAFLLPPAGGGLDETKRRAALLARRTEWMALGIPVEEYPDSMRDDNLLSMPPADQTALQRSVVVCGPAQLSRHTVEEAVESAERLGQRASTDYYGARVQEQQQIQAARDTQLELDGHFVLGVGSAWGGNPELLSPAPRFMDMEEFVCEAAACGAIVILAAHDTLTATGELQQLLEGAGIAYTGVTADYALSCCNRIALNKAVTEIADSITAAASNTAEDADSAIAADDADESAVGLIPMPIKVLKTDRLLNCLRTPQDFEALFADLMVEWEASDSFVLRPPSDTAGLGVARIHTPQDLAVYAAAIADALPRLPPGSLSQQQSALTLPLEPPALLVAEPWVGTDPVGVAVGADGGLEVTWEGSSSRWLEVSIGLMGELGSMSALPLTLVSRAADGSRQHITPPPAHILPAESIEAAQGCAVAIALGLGLRSIASVDGFVHADTGELIVREVKPTPPLTDGSPLVQQVMQLDPPLLPHQLFRQLARDAWLTNKAAQAAAAAGSSSISSAFYSTPAELGAADFELAGVGGDIFAGSGGGEGFDAAEEEGDAAGGVEDGDMQAAGFTA